MSGLIPLKLTWRVTVAGWGPIFLGQPFPEQSEELRLEAMMMGGCKQRFFLNVTEMDPNELCICIDIILYHT